MIDPSHASVALAAKLTTAEALPRSLSTVMFPGQVTMGTLLASKAPMSTCEQNLRGKPGPRWSVLRIAGASRIESSPALMAGLPASSAWVKLGPPLSCNGPSIGLTSVLSPAAVNPVAPDELPTRLWPAELNVPDASG